MSLSQGFADPFGVTADPAGYIPRDATEEALDALVRCVRDEGRSAVLCGVPGIGKTLLLHLLAERVHPDLETVYLPYVALPAEALCGWALELLGAASSRDPAGALLAYAQRSLADGRGLVLLVDEAQTVPPSAVRRLGGLAASSGQALRLVAASDHETAQHTIVALGPDVDVVRLTVPMTVDETSVFLDRALERAEIPEDARARFDARTVARLHETSGGIPRRLHNEASAVLRGINLLPPIEEANREISSLPVDHDEVSPWAGGVDEAPLPGEATQPPEPLREPEPEPEPVVAAEVEPIVLEPEPEPVPVAVAEVEPVVPEPEPVVAVEVEPVVPASEPVVAAEVESADEPPASDAAESAAGPSEAALAPDEPIPEDTEPVSTRADVAALVRSRPPLATWIALAAIAGLLVAGGAALLWGGSPVEPRAPDPGAEKAPAQQTARAEPVPRKPERAPPPVVPAAAEPPPQQRAAPLAGVGRTTPAQSEPTAEPAEASDPVPEAAPPDSPPVPDLEPADSPDAAPIAMARLEMPPPPVPVPVLEAEPAEVEVVEPAAAPAVPVGVQINARPWATISIDGDEVGETPLAGIPVPAGPHTFAARFPDGRTVERVVDVAADNRHLSFE